MPPPRPITPHVKRASWFESGPKTWILLAALTLIGGLIVGVSQAQLGIAERTFIQNSDVIDAKIIQISGQDFRRNESRASALSVRVQYAPPAVNGQSNNLIDTTGQLSVVIGKTISVGDTLPLRVSRSVPTTWNDRLEPLAWPRRLALPGVLVLLGFPMLLIAWIKRRTILSTWQSGTAMSGRVASVQASALSPMSKSLSVTEPGGRVLAVLWPTRLGPLEVGDAIDIVVGSATTRTALALRHFEFTK